MSDAKIARAARVYIARRSVISEIHVKIRQADPANDG